MSNFCVQQIIFSTQHDFSLTSNGRSSPEVVGSIPTEVKIIFFFTSCVSLIQLTRANAQWVFHGFHISTLIYTSKLIFCSTTLGISSPCGICYITLRLLFCHFYTAQVGQDDDLFTVKNSQQLCSSFWIVFSWSALRNQEELVLSIIT